MLKINETAETLSFRDNATMHYGDVDQGVELDKIRWSLLIYQLRSCISNEVKLSFEQGYLNSSYSTEEVGHFSN